MAPRELAPPDIRPLKSRLFPLNYVRGRGSGQQEPGPEKPDSQSSRGSIMLRWWVSTVAAALIPGSESHDFQSGPLRNRTFGFDPVSAKIVLPTAWHGALFVMARTGPTRFIHLKPIRQVQRSRSGEPARVRMKLGSLREPSRPSRDRGHKGKQGFTTESHGGPRRRNKALRAVCDRTPREAPESSLLRGPPWFSVFSVVKVYLPCTVRAPRSHRRARHPTMCECRRDALGHDDEGAVPRPLARCFGAHGTRLEDLLAQTSRWWSSAKPLRPEMPGPVPSITKQGKTVTSFLSPVSMNSLLRGARTLVGLMSGSLTFPASPGLILAEPIPA
jgi:hypothetical protein